MFKVLRLLWPAALLLIAAAMPFDAGACSCFPGITLEQQMASATHILVGRVVATRQRPRDGDIESGWLMADVLPLQAIKGSNPSLRQLRTAAGSASCGARLQVALSYIFLAAADGEISVCRGTFQYIEGDEQSEELLKKIKQAVSSTRTP